MCERDIDSAGHSHCRIGEDSRRGFLKGTLAVSAGAVIAGVAPPETVSAATAITAIGLAKSHVDKPFERYRFNRRHLGHDDVLIDVLYCGVCHTDIHYLDGSFGPLRGPLVPGHEMVGRVRAVGVSVSRFKPGDFAGVGTIVDSCGACKYCQLGLEPYCMNGFTPTYGYTSAGTVQGGYATSIVVKDRFALNIRPNVNLAATAPLLCAGITTYSSMQHWKVAKGQKVGIVGLGGLGHAAVKFAVDVGAEVTVFSTTPTKRQAALALGAAHFVEWSETSAFPALRNQFDYIVSTVPKGFDLGIFTPTLAVDGTFANVGTLGPMDKPLDNSLLLAARRQITGSAVGGLPETQRMLDYCAERNITADIELIGPDRIDEAFRRILSKQVRFRFVLDMARLG